METGPIKVFIGWGRERVNIKRRFKLCVYICILWYTSVAYGHIHTVPCVPGLKYSEVSVWQLWMLSSLNGRLERSKGNSWRGDNCRVLPGGHAAAVPTPPPHHPSSRAQFGGCSDSLCILNLILCSQYDTQEKQRRVQILDTELISHIFLCVFCLKVDIKWCIAQQKLEELDDVYILSLLG